MRRIRSMLVTGAAVAAAAVGGGAIANAASSTNSTTTTTTPAPSSSTAAPRAPANFPAHGTAAHEDTEKAVTGTTADKAKAAAVKSVGGGTAGDVTTNYTGDGYEVTVTNGSTTTEVHLDSSFTVQSGPGGMHGPGDPPPGGASGSGAAYGPGVAG